MFFSTTNGYKKNNAQQFITILLNAHEKGEFDIDLSASTPNGAKKATFTIMIDGETYDNSDYKYEKIKKPLH